METHTDTASSVFYSSVSLTAVSQALPLKWKCTRVAASHFQLEADRDAVGHIETWQITGMIVSDEVRLQLAVHTMVIDSFEFGVTPGHTNIMTQTKSIAIAANELNAVPVSRESAAHLQRIILSLMQDIKVRREQFSLEAHNG